MNVVVNLRLEDYINALLLAHSVAVRARLSTTFDPVSPFFARTNIRHLIITKCAVPHYKHIKWQAKSVVNSQYLSYKQNSLFASARISLCMQVENYYFSQDAV